ncbi:hypothetical protein YC2023_043910 [Brassica napus]
MMTVEVIVVRTNCHLLHATLETTTGSGTLITLIIEHLQEPLRTLPPRDTENLTTMVHPFIARLQERAEDLFERTLGSYLVESRFKTRMFLLTLYQIQLGILAHCHLIPLPHVTSENDLTFLQRQGVQGASLLLNLVKEDLFWHVLVDQAQVTPLLPVGLLVLTRRDSKRWRLCTMGLQDRNISALSMRALLTVARARAFMWHYVWEVLVTPALLYLQEIPLHLRSSTSTLKQPVNGRYLKQPPLGSGLWPEAH